MILLLPKTPANSQKYIIGKNVKTNDTCILIIYTVVGVGKCLLGVVLHRTVPSHGTLR